MMSEKFLVKFQPDFYTVNASLLVALLFQQPHSFTDLGDPPYLMVQKKLPVTFQKLPKNKGNSGPTKAVIKHSRLNFQEYFCYFAS